MARYQEKKELENSLIKTFNALLIYHELQANNVITIENIISGFPAEIEKLLDKGKMIKTLRSQRDDFQKNLSTRIAEIEQAILTFSRFDKDQQEIDTLTEKVLASQAEMKEIKGELIQFAKKQKEAEQKLDGLKASFEIATSPICNYMKSSTSDTSVKTREGISKEMILKIIAKKEKDKHDLEQLGFQVLKAQEVLLNAELNPDNSKIVQQRLSLIKNIKETVQQELQKNDQESKSLYSTIQVLEDIGEEDINEKLDSLIVRANEECCLLVRHRGNKQRELEESENIMNELMKERVEKENLRLKKQEEKSLLETQLDGAKVILSTGIESFNKKIDKCYQETQDMKEDVKKSLLAIIAEETEFQIDFLLLKKASRTLPKELGKEVIRKKGGGIVNKENILASILESRLSQDRKLTSASDLICELRENIIK